MRYTQAEKMEIIRLVEESDWPVKRTLAELGISRSTYYRWYDRYVADGYDGLADRKPGPEQCWNQIPDEVRQQVVEVALERPDQSPRQLAWHFTDEKHYFVSESSVYRILKRYDLITSPAFDIVKASDKFKHPTKRVNEMWQTDFTQFKVIGWGWYYLCTVLDDFSRYIIAWRLAPTMAATDVQETLTFALDLTGIEHVQVKHRPRLLSDNGPAFIAEALAEFLKPYDIHQIHGRPRHPQTQGKIERYHRSMKSIVKLNTFFFPWELEQAIADFVAYYNYERYHESLDNVTPADVFLGRQEEVLTQRDLIKQQTLLERRQLHLQTIAAGVQ
jgi:transposase InsO family protein